MLEVELLNKTYGKYQALNNLSFSLKKGEIVALLGPNGAGKSTTMKILTGFLLPDSGNIYLNGLAFLPHSAKDYPQRIKQKIGYLPENNPLYPDLLVREYLEFVAKIYGVSWGSKDIKYVLEKVGLGQKMNQKIQNLSKGYKQRVGLAQTLLHKPDLLILDEPTTGLDPNQIVEIRALIQELGQEKTILLSTHILQEVQICSDLILLHQGKMMAHQKTNTLGQQIIEIETEYPDFIQALSTWEEIQKIQKVGDFKYEIISPTTTFFLRKKIAEWAINRQIIISTLHEKTNSLEKIFQELTK